MPIDANIYGQFAPKVTSPMEVQNGLMSQQQAAMQMQDAQLAMQQKRQAMAQDVAMQQAVRESGGDPAKLRQAYVDRGMADALDKHDKTQAEIQSKAAAAKKDASIGAEHDATTLSKNLELAYRRMSSVNPHDDEAIVGLYDQSVKDGLFGPDKRAAADRAVASIQTMPPANTPERLKWFQTQLAQGLDLKTQAEQAAQAQVRAEQARHNVSTEKTAQGHLGVAQGHLALDRTKAAQEQAVGGLEGFSPAAIENAAARYNLDGTLPPMGMGKAGSQGRQAILNRAAELAQGKSGIEQRVSQLDNKSAAAALTKVTAQKSMVSAFEKNANANADLALDLSEKNDRTNVNILNKWIQAGRKGTGSPEAAQFNAANETFVNEYAKIMSGSMGNTAVSDSARTHAHEIIATANSKEQYRAVMGTLRQEMKNRMKGFEDEEQALRSRLGGKSEAPAAAPAGKVVHFGDLK